MSRQPPIRIAVTPALAKAVARRRELMNHTQKMRPRDWLQEINDLDNDIACEFAFLVEQAFKATTTTQGKKP